MDKNLYFFLNSTNPSLIDRKRVQQNFSVILFKIPDMYEPIQQSEVFHRKFEIYEDQKKERILIDGFIYGVCGE